MFLDKYDIISEYSSKCYNFLYNIFIILLAMLEQVKQDQKMQTLLQQFQIRHPKRLCNDKQGNQVTHICLNSQCKENALICQIQECAHCFDKHLDCRLVNFKSVTKYLKDKAQGQRQFLLNLLQKLSDFIHQTQRTTKALIEGFYLKDLQKKYFDIVEALYIKQQQKYQIKGALANDFYQQLRKTSKEVIQDRPKMISTIEFQINKISQSLSDLKTQMIDQFANEGMKKELTILQNSKIIAKQNLQQRRFIDDSLNHPKKMQLLFRASENGFDCGKFHLACNNISHTFTLIRNQFGKTLAGYTPLTWNSTNNAYSRDQSYKTFILSIDLKQKFSLVFGQNAIRCSDTYGPTFGGGYDISISNKCNENNSSYAKFPHSFNGSKVYKQNQETFSTFCGNRDGPNFKVLEYEVYRVDWN